MISPITRNPQVDVAGLVQELEAVRAKDFIIILPFFYRCRMIAIATLPSLISIFQVGEKKNDNEQMGYVS